jgi:hypothetical protein
LYQESAVAGEAAGLAIGLVHKIIHSIKISKLYSIICSTRTTTIVKNCKIKRVTK